MSKSERPTMELQKQYWKYWNSRSGYPHDGALRRGDKILTYLRCLRLDRPRILDMGCGMGWLANELSQFGPTMGIDLSEEAIAQAKSQFPHITFEAGNLFEMTLPKLYFDIVVSQEVIAHVADQSGYLERAARALKAGGHLIVTTPNPFVHKRCQWPAIPPGHIELWLSPRALSRLLRLHFRVVRRTTAVPLGHQGILRVVNSTKVNNVLGFLFGPERVRDFKEWADFGWTQVVLAQKKS